MARPKNNPASEIVPMLKTIEQMSLISGIGQNRLREMIEKGEIDYIRNGKRFLLADKAIWDWYERNRVTAAQSA